MSSQSVEWAWRKVPAVCMLQSLGVGLSEQSLGVVQSLDGCWRLLSEQSVGFVLQVCGLPCWY